MRPCLSALVLLSGCFYVGPLPKLATDDSGSDTSIDTDESLSDWSALEAMPQFTGSTSSCGSETPYRVATSPVTITSATTISSAATIDPGSAATNVAMSHFGNTVGATDASTRDLYGADTWVHEVAQGDSDEGSMFNCGPDSTGDTDAAACSGLYRTTVAPTPTGLIDCGELGTPEIVIDGTFTTAHLYRPPADCENGSGRFVIYPLVIRDNDGDGRGRYVSRAVQVSGTGVMTSRSSITSISVVSAPTQLRVVKKNQTYSFNGNDVLIDAGSNSIGLSGTMNFESGVIAGNPDFVVMEPANTSIGSFWVDMTWSCEASGGTSAAAPLGYQFRLATVGLTVPQKLVLRPRFNLTPKRIEWELYGDPRARFVTPVTVTGEGHAFDLTWGRFELAGVFLNGTSESASVRLDSLKYNGEDYGTPGTYTFGVE